MRLLILTTLLALSLSANGGNVADQRRASTPILTSAPIEWALAQIESGHFKNPDKARGASGEVSRFQIMPEVWKTYSRSKNYSNPEVAWNVARRILKDRHAWFVRATGREPSAFDLYVMWNKPGLYERVAFNRHRLPRTLRELAMRFENLVYRSDTAALLAKRADNSAM